MHHVAVGGAVSTEVDGIVGGYGRRVRIGAAGRLEFRGDVAQVQHLVAGQIQGSLRMRHLHQVSVLIELEGEALAETDAVGDADVVHRAAIGNNFSAALGQGTGSASVAGVVVVQAGGTGILLYQVGAVVAVADGLFVVTGEDHRIEVSAGLVRYDAAQVVEDEGVPYIVRRHERGVGVDEVAVIVAVVVVFYRAGRICGVDGAGIAFVR